MIENEVIKNMKQRFSCRKFLSTPVEEEKIHACLDAAKYAPSGHNQQGWHFTVITSEGGKKMLLEAAGETPTEMFTKMMPDKKWPYPDDFFGAPVIILISGKTDVPWPSAGPYLAAGNIMNAAASLGLASTWMTLYSKDLFRDEKSRTNKDKMIPEGNEMYAALFLGYPEKVPENRAKRRENVETWL